MARQRARNVILSCICANLVVGWSASVLGHDPKATRAAAGNLDHRLDGVARYQCPAGLDQLGREKAGVPGPGRELEHALSGLQAELLDQPHRDGHPHLADAVGAAEAPAALAQAERLGVLVPVGEGIYEVPSPSLLAVAEEVVRRGISLDSALAVLEEIERHCDSVSRSFVQLFLKEVWKPFEQADMPPERWPEVQEAVQRLRPVAADALIAIFQQRLSTQIEAAFKEMTKRLSERGP